MDYKLVFLFVTFTSAYAATTYPEPSKDLLTPFEPSSIPRTAPLVVNIQPQTRFNKPSSDVRVATPRPTSKTSVIVTPPPVRQRVLLQPVHSIPAHPQPIPSPLHHNSRLHGNQGAQIVKQVQDIAEDGKSYGYSFESDNGILVQEQGELKQISKDEVAMEVKGAFQYLSPEGTPIALTYIANENGYQPQGSHLPTPPPIPEHIIKAIEYIRSHPSN